MSPTAIWIRQKLRVNDAQGALAALLLALAVFGVFGGTLSNGFTWWDDPATIHANRKFHPPSGESIRHYWTTPAAGLYVPLTYSYWGALAYVSNQKPDDFGVCLNARIFHAGSILMHLASALVVLSILRMLSGNTWAAFGGALLFAVHPVQVESVAWASGAKDVLFGLLSLCAIYQYLIFAKTRREALDQPESTSKKAWAYYISGAVMLILAMLAKPTAVVVPIVVAALDLLVIRRKPRAVALSAGAWMLIIAPLAIVAKIVQTAAGVASTAWWQKPLLACDTITFYLWKLLAPVNLAPDYARRPAGVLEMLSGNWIYIAWIIPAVVTLLLWSRRKTHAWLVAAGLCFVTVLLPVLGFVPFMFQYTSGVADHYLYLAMLGPAIAMTWLLVRHNTTATRAGCGIALACFAGLSIAQGRLWKDDVTLWTHNINVAPTSFVAPNNVAAALGRQSRILSDLSLAAAEAGNKPLADDFQQRRRELLEQAIVLLERAVANHPNYVTARHNLFVYHLRLGRPQPAVEHLEAMLRANEVAPPHMKENFTTYHDTAGLLWMRLEKWDRAQAHFEELLRRVPGHQTASRSLELVKQKAAEARLDPGD